MTDTQSTTTERVDAYRTDSQIIDLLDSGQLDLGLGALEERGILIVDTIGYHGITDPDQYETFAAAVNNATARRHAENEAAFLASPELRVLTSDEVTQLEDLHCETSDTRLSEAMWDAVKARRIEVVMTSEDITEGKVFVRSLSGGAA